MKNLIAIILVLSLVACFAGCNETATSSMTESDSYIKSEHNEVDDVESNVVSEDSEPQSNNQSAENDVIKNENTSSSNTDTSDLVEDYSSNIKKESVKINSLDALNFYAVKKALAGNDTTLLSSTKGSKATTMSNVKTRTASNLINLNTTSIDKNSTFTITMYSYFTVTLSDTNGFLARKLGGTGSVEVVITRNNFSNMITFKKGERYYSCLETSSNDNAMSFSSHKYVDGYNLVENVEAENYEFVVYFEGDRVIGVNCGRFSDGENFKYSVDEIKFNDNFSFIVHKKQSFSASQLEQLFATNNLFVDDGVVLDDGTVLFAKAKIMDDTVALKTDSGKTISKKDIENVSALYNSKYGFCIKLDMLSPDLITGKIKCSLFVGESKYRELTLQKDGSAIYITDLNNKSRMSDVYYKLIAIDTSGRIGKIINHDDFAREMSKRINLNDYKVSKRYSGKFKEYTYNLKSDKSVSYRESNYEITVDDITFSLPIKVSDLLAKGFTVEEENINDPILQFGSDFISPKGNEMLAFVMNFYGDSTNFYDCYVTQVDFSCIESSNGQEGIRSTRPDFDIMEGINKDSSIDDVVLRLGEPNHINIAAIDNDGPFYDWCLIQLAYDIVTPTIPNGSIWFTFMSSAKSDAPTESLESVNYSIH